MTERRLTYLAVPYSHPDREVRLARFKAANIAAGMLMRGGCIVFSPISHTHPILEDGQLPHGWGYWHAFDLAYLQVSKNLVVLCIEGWRESEGVQAEIAIATEAEMPILYIDETGRVLVDGELVTEAEAKQ